MSLLRLEAEDIDLPCEELYYGSPVPHAEWRVQEFFCLIPTVCGRAFVRISMVDVSAAHSQVGTNSIVCGVNPSRVRLYRNTVCSFYIVRVDFSLVCYDWDSSHPRYVVSLYSCVMV